MSGQSRVESQIVVAYNQIALQAAHAHSLADAAFQQIEAARQRHVSDAQANYAYVLSTPNAVETRLDAAKEVLATAELNAQQAAQTQHMQVQRLLERTIYLHNNAKAALHEEQLSEQTRNQLVHSPIVEIQYTTTTPATDQLKALVEAMNTAWVEFEALTTSHWQKVAFRGNWRRFLFAETKHREERRRNTFR